MSDSDLITRLGAIVGQRFVLPGHSAAAKRHLTGFRHGSGEAVAIVLPGSLVEQWRILHVCINAGAIILMQAANTGLTGGSTPDGQYDRPVVVISTTRLNGIHLLNNGREVLCLPGSTLDQLEHVLAPLGREPHSVIGSSCLGASVIGGICNNSGGALLQRGPAYTEMALFARCNAAGQLELVNRLGIVLPNDPEDLLQAVEHGDFDPDPASGCARGSAADYVDKVRDINSPDPARYNADPGYLHDASGSAGHVAVFAVRLDSFPKARDTQVFYVGTNDPDELTRLRRHVLANFQTLPVSAEYLHRDCYDLAAGYGKDMHLLIGWLGTQRLPLLNRLKDRLDRIASRIPFLPDHVSGRLTLALARLLPAHLPARMAKFRDRYAHHLLIRCADDGISEMRAHLATVFPSETGNAFECAHAEGEKAFLHRFVAAGAAVRYRDTHAGRNAGLVSLDIALPRNCTDWFEALPAELDAVILQRIYYGHFFCHVFHQDYVIRPGVDPHKIEAELLAFQKTRGAQYPAEHNVGHVYDASDDLARHYQALDPCNHFNPGVGKLSRAAHWGADQAC